ncbi:MAG: WG repeat-containing protein, partial [Clostridia bacterium]|nr:WG repeat-containing protein [Clostridia bacterium]
MNRLILVCLMILTLCLSVSLAEEEAQPLYPIRENGLWGYMNRAGEVVIEPQWMKAETFSGGVAIVEADGEQKDGQGLIRTNGE